MNRYYIGCENAASATAKIEVVSSYNYITQAIYYFGDVNDAIIKMDRFMDMSEKQKLILHYYNCFEKVGNKWVEAEF